MSRKIMKCNSRAREYLDSLPRIYIVAKSNKGSWSILECPFDGKMRKAITKDGIKYIPQVWAYKDTGHDGIYILNDIDFVPYSSIYKFEHYTWTFDSNVAEKICHSLNGEEKVWIE